jgi:hypothetical protein
MQQEAGRSELLAAHKSASQSWQEERQQLTESTAKWRQKAVELQREVRPTLPPHLLMEEILCGDIIVAGL